jgi:hypothetical protein
MVIKLKTSIQVPIDAEVEIDGGLWRPVSVTPGSSVNFTLVKVQGWGRCGFAQWRGNKWSLMHDPSLTRHNAERLITHWLELT